MSSLWHENYNPITLEALNARGKNTMVEWLGIECIEIGDDFLAARMPVDHRTRQLLGIMHGGASCVLAETVGRIASNLVLNSQTHYSVGLSIYTSHFRSVKEGYVIGTATAIHLGKTTQVWNIAIKTEEGKLVSDTRLTMAVLERKT